MQFEASATRKVGLDNITCFMILTEMSGVDVLDLVFRDCCCAQDICCHQFIEQMYNLF